MTSRAGAGLLVVLGVVGNAGCSRADVYAITGQPTTDGGPSDLGVQPVPDAGPNDQDGEAAADEDAGDQDAAAVTCPSPTLQSGDMSMTLQVGSLTRSYVLHIPPTYDGSQPAPLVVDYHGIGSSGWDELSSSPYPAVTDPEGVVMAFPDGMPGPIGTGWNMGPCCVADVDDFAFTRALVNQIQATTCIDSSRIYAVGVLTGGGMVHSLACRAADVFAAVAPAAFDLIEEMLDDCNPSRPITVISFRGTADSRVPYTGGASSLVPGMPITFLGAEASFEQWAQIDGCTGSPSTPDSDGCSSYSACPTGVEVVLCTKQDGREEPGDANIAWPALKRHTL
jgi:polyhydroxybutyrate depolymerase